MARGNKVQAQSVRTVAHPRDDSYIRREIIEPKNNLYNCTRS